MTRILFVCLGNICRSPLAEYLMIQLIAEAGLTSDFEIASAATSNEEYQNPIYPPMMRTMREKGINGIDGHRPQNHHARRITREDYNHFDMIIGMDANNLRDMQRFWNGDPEQKISLLLDHTPESDTQFHHRNVADPWYTGDFETTYIDVKKGCKAILQKLQNGQI